MTRRLEVVLRRPPPDVPAESDFEIVERPLEAPAAGALLVRSAYLSLDPYLGSRLRGRHMGEPAPAPGEGLPGQSVGEVLESADPAFRPGDWVVGEMGWADLGLMRAASARKVSVDPPPSAHLGVLGMPGLTAWAGVTQLAKVRAGDVFTVDAAAGAVGGVAGQLARALGARVVGIAGGREKCEQVRAMGFDAAVDYRAPDWPEALAAAAAPGPTVHFENVGASVLLPVLQRMQTYGRVVLCGLAEHYHQAAPAQLPIGLVMGKRAILHGLIVYDFYPRWQEWIDLATPLVLSGALRIVEDVSEGAASAPAQFARLMRGENVGKTLVRMEAA